VIIMKIYSNLKHAVTVASVVWMAVVPMAFAQSAPQLVTNGPQFSSGDEPGNGSGRRNVIESERYERVLRANTGFREQRMRKECGSIDDRGLHEQCLASFQ
jgi:hypothetical protein